jgi:hypothetical protein
VGTDRTEERVLASLGQLAGAPIRFEAADAVVHAGVLCALPALLAFGLLRHTRPTFQINNGFYPLETIFLSLAFLALARVQSFEALRYQAPEEWGKLLGLDRIPEVKTLREKLGQLCQSEEVVNQWSATLSKEWMQADPEQAGVLYIDGHVRVYHGRLANVPKRYVSRQRLRMRGVIDYWVNAMDGQPFFSVTQTVDPKIVRMLQEEILPRLLKEVPQQAPAQELENNPRRHRLVIVFDREGYSPELMKTARDQRVAVVTYKKNTTPQASIPWPQEEFGPHSVELVNGETVQMQLAERGVLLSNGMWVREVRQLETGGNQIAIIATDYVSDLRRIAAVIFARWCQENFFKYMAEHYSLDRLVEYVAKPLPETTRIVNPAWRQYDSAMRRERALLQRDQAKLAATTLRQSPTPREIAQFPLDGGQLLQDIQTREATIENLKTQRKATERHIQLKDLPQNRRFQQLSSVKKHFVDTIKLICYRAETAIIHLLREKLGRADDARTLARQIFQSTADLRPDTANNVLTVRLHSPATVAHRHVLDHLCAELTDTQTEFPGTNLQLKFEVLGSP